MKYYVYEILIDGEVVYVGSSQSVDEKFSKDDPHRYKRLIAHGYFLNKFTALRHLQKGKTKFKKEILEAKVSGKNFSFNILGDNLSAEEAGSLESKTIEKYGVSCIARLPEIDENGEIKFIETRVGGKLLNKIHAPKIATTNRKGKFSKFSKFSKSVHWWYRLSEEEREKRRKELSIINKEKMKKMREEKPELYYEIQKKWKDAGVAAAKDSRNRPERLKQMSESLKRRWARGESWIAAKNEQSRQFMKNLLSQPEQIERSRKACIERNKNPEWQLQKVKKLYFAIINNGKSFENWKTSYKELVAEGLYPKKSFRDWKKYFNTEKELIKYCYEN